MVFACCAVRYVMSCATVILLVMEGRSQRRVVDLGGTEVAHQAFAPKARQQPKLACTKALLEELDSTTGAIRGDGWIK